MAFLCPVCGGPRLAITHSLELPPDEMSDEITVQVLRCAACSFTGLAVYEESRRGSSERFHHSGFECPPATAERVTGLIQQCPTPSSQSCTCATHVALGGTEHGRWCGLASVGVTGSKSFSMELSE
jgi:hypothetical protein